MSRQEFILDLVAFRDSGLADEVRALLEKWYPGHPGALEPGNAQPKTEVAPEPPKCGDFGQMNEEQRSNLPEPTPTETKSYGTTLR